MAGVGVGVNIMAGVGVGVNIGVAIIGCIGMYPFTRYDSRHMSVQVTVVPEGLSASFALCHLCIHVLLFLSLN